MNGNGNAATNGLQKPVMQYLAVGSPTAALMLKSNALSCIYKALTLLRGQTVFNLERKNTSISKLSTGTDSYLGTCREIGYGLQ